MQEMPYQLLSDPRVAMVFAGYPKAVRPKMERLREWVLETAGEMDGLKKLEETLKWGEPSYLTKHGATLRMDWKEKAPDRYALYFSCTSKLVPTFREIYPTEFAYEGNRALVLRLDEQPNVEALKHCIATALRYHKVKGEALLGM